MIVTDISENDPADSYLWDLSEINEDSVWVYASISDEDTTIWDYSDGPLIIEHSSGFVHENKTAESPNAFMLESIYPNPFNSTTRIRFGLPISDMVEIRIFNSMGRLCGIPLSGKLSEGYHEITWSPDNLPSGIYLIELCAQNFRERTKVVYLK